MRIEVTIHDGPPPAVVDRIHEEVRAENVRRFAVGEDVELAVLATRDGVLVGACCGATWGGTCELESLWVEPGSRHEGLGSLLLNAAEEEAARRGCHQVVLLTHTTPGPSIYESHGFEEVGAVDDYPEGARAVWWRKKLDATRSFSHRMGDA